MAKRKAARRAKPAKTARRTARRTVKNVVKRKAGAARKALATRKAPAKPAGKKARAVARKVVKRAVKRAVKKVAREPAVSRPKPKAAPRATNSAAAPAKVPRLDRARRTLDERETHDTPPSSLDMDRHGSAAQTGRAEMAQNIREHHGMDDVTGGDPDVNIEDAYFAGEEAPGGDNPTPDQDIVEDIGKALGVTYEDNEQLKGSDKVAERDKHRWELDPASSDDYNDRD